MMESLLRLSVPRRGVGARLKRGWKVWETVLRQGFQVVGWFRL